VSNTNNQFPAILAVAAGLLYAAQHLPMVTTGWWRRTIIHCSRNTH